MSGLPCLDLKPSAFNGYGMLRHRNETPDLSEAMWVDLTPAVKTPKAQDCRKLAFSELLA